jgi:carbon storage regulator
MLVLSRKIGERIHINDDVVITVIRIQGDKVRLGIEAPRIIPVHRAEVLERIRIAAALAPQPDTSAPGMPASEERPTRVARRP